MMRENENLELKVLRQGTRNKKHEIKEYVTNR